VKQTRFKQETVGGCRKLRLPGLQRVEQWFKLVAASCKLMRMVQLPDRSPAWGLAPVVVVTGRRLSRVADAHSHPDRARRASVRPPPKGHQSPTRFVI